MTWQAISTRPYLQRGRVPRGRRIVVLHAPAAVIVILNVLARNIHAAVVSVVSVASVVSIVNIVDIVVTSADAGHAAGPAAAAVAAVA